MVLEGVFEYELSATGPFTSGGRSATPDRIEPPHPATPHYRGEVVCEMFKFKIMTLLQS